MQPKIVQISKSESTRRKRKGFSTWQYCRNCRNCSNYNCEGKQPNPKWTWSADYQMKIEWGSQIISARGRVPRIFQKNDLCNKAHFCSVLERLKRTNQSHGTLFEFDCYFCRLIINPCKEALKSISCYRTLSILRFVIEILRHLRKILSLRR